MSTLSSKVIFGLAAAALVGMVVSTVTSISRQPLTDSAQTKRYVLPELHEHLNEVKSLLLTTAGDKDVVELKREGQRWTVAEKAGDTADSAKVRALLLKLAEARLLEAKTAIEQKYPELGVEDVKGKDAKGVQLSLGGLAKPVRLIIGNLSEKADGTFVRRPEERKSWLAQGHIEIERDPLNWLDKRLADLSAEHIAEISLSRREGKPVRLLKKQRDDTTFTIDALPKGREPAEPSVLDGLATTLAGLTLLDVEAAPPSADSAALTARYRSFEGIGIEIRAWPQDDKHYARLTAALDQKTADAYLEAELTREKDAYTAAAKPAGEKTESEPAPLPVSDPEKYRQERREKLAADVEALNRRYTGRQFLIAADTYASLNKSMEDLLKPAPAKSTAGSTAKGKKSKR